MESAPLLARCPALPQEATCSLGQILPPGNDALGMTTVELNPRLEMGPELSLKEYRRMEG